MRETKKHLHAHAAAWREAQRQYVHPAPPTRAQTALAHAKHGAPFVVAAAGLVGAAAAIAVFVSAHLYGYAAGVGSLELLGLSIFVGALRR